MREEFLEPLPAPQTNAKLVMDGAQVICMIIEATPDGFRVAVPGVEQYEGDPKMTLVTRNSVFPVRLVRQEAHVGGYAYRLQRLEGVPEKCYRLNRKVYWRSVTAQCCAAGVIGVIAASCFCIPSSCDLIPLLSRRGLRIETVGAWSPSIAESDLLPPEISIDNGQVADSDRSSNRGIRLASVSMISPVSMSYLDEPNAENDRPDRNSVRQGHHVQPSGNTAKSGKRANVLRDLLEEGQTGRVRPASHDLLTWLNAGAPVTGRISFRMSDAASQDLQQFQGGLGMLPAESSMKAVESLRLALVAASQNLPATRSVHETCKLFVVACEDAKIYFRKAPGQIELVRVLPIDLDKAELP